jgi:hypothetical protein
VNTTIDQIIQSLNSTTPGQAWIALEGLHALTTVINNGQGNISFNPGSGIVVKTFLNQSTGEIKLFPAKLFGFPENNAI